MTVPRIALSLAAVGMVMLAVVELRVRAARAHFEISQMEARAATLANELRVSLGELEKLRNPARLWGRARELATESVPEARPAPKPQLPPRRRGNP